MLPTRDLIVNYVALYTYYTKRYVFMSIAVHIDIFLQTLIVTRKRREAATLLTILLRTRGD